MKPSFTHRSLLSLFAVISFFVSAHAQVTVSELESGNSICAWTEHTLTANIDQSIGNNAPFTYLWGDGSTEASILKYFFDTPETISLTVTDNTGKQYEKSYTVTPVNIKLDAPEFVTVESGESGIFQMGFSGGIPPYEVKFTDAPYSFYEKEEGKYATTILSDDGEFYFEVLSGGCVIDASLPYRVQYSKTTKIESSNGITEACKGGATLALTVASQYPDARFALWEVNGKLDTILPWEEQFVSRFMPNDTVTVRLREGEGDYIATFDRAVAGLRIGNSGVESSITIRTDEEVYIGSDLLVVTAIAEGNSGDVSYDWYPSISSIEGNTQEIQAWMPQNYTVVATDKTGCNASADFLVLPLLDTKEKFVLDEYGAKCVGNSVYSVYPMLHNGTADITVLDYIWYRNNDTTILSRSRSVTGERLVDGDSLTVFASYQGHLLGSASKTVQLNTPLDIAVKQLAPVSAGETATLNGVYAKDGAPLPANGHFSWFSVPYETIPWNNINNETLVTEAISGTTYIELEYTDTPNGCTAKSSLTILPSGKLSVLLLADNIDRYGEGLPICAGDTVKLSVAASGGAVQDSDPAKYSYSWSSVPEGVFSKEPFLVTAPKVTTSYTVSVSDGTSTVEKSWTVDVAGAVSRTILIDSITAYGASDGAITVKAQDEGAVLYLQMDGYWEQAPPSIRNLSAGTFITQLTIHGEVGIISCTNDTTILTQPLPDLTISAEIQDNLCAGGESGSISLSAENALGDVIYSWSNGSATASITGLKAGTYTVTVTVKDADQSKIESYDILDGNTYQYTPIVTPVTCGKTHDGSAYFKLEDYMPNPKFTWSSGLTGNYADTLPEGTYTVTVTDNNGCVDEVSFTVGALNTPMVNLGRDTALCADETVTLRAPIWLDGDANTYSYKWSDGSFGNTLIVSEAGLYSVTVTSLDECSSNASIYVGEVYSGPHNICNVNILPSGAAEVALNEYGFEYINNYKLYRDDTLIATVPHADGRIFVDESADANTAIRSYTVKAQNTCGDLPMLSYPKPTPFLSGVREEGDNILSWHADMTTSEIFIYRGISADNLQPYDTSYMSGQYRDTLPLKKAYYKVLIYDYMNCTMDTIRTNTALISVLPKIDFTVSNTIVGVGQEVEFVAHLGAADSHIWDFEGGDIAQSPGEVVKQIYSTPGTYDVKLTAENASGSDSLVKLGLVTVAGIHERNAFACYGADINFTATPLEGAVYTWSNGMKGQSIQFPASQSGKIGLTITGTASNILIKDSVSFRVSTPISLADVAIPCAGDSTLVAFKGYEAYSWNGADATGLSKYYLAKEDALYTIWARDSSGCTSSDELQVGAFRLRPTVSLGGDISVCAGSSVQLSIETQGDVLWSNAATEHSITVTASGKYYAEVTENGCSAADTVYVTVHEAPKLGFIGVTADAQNNAGIFWDDLPAFVQYAVKLETNAAGEYLTLGTVKSADSAYYSHKPAGLGAMAGLYSIDATDTCGNITSMDVSSIHLQAITTMDGSISLLWSAPSGITTPSYYIFRGTTSDNMSLYQTVAGTFTALSDTDPIDGALYAVGVKADVPAQFLTGSWQAGYMISNIAKSGFISSLPHADFKASRTHIGVGSMVMFSSLADKANSVSWEFEGGAPAKASDPEVLVEYLTAGTYTVSLYAENADGNDILVRKGYITVGGVVADSIRFLKDIIQMRVGEFVQPQLSFYPYDTEDKTVSFTSSDNSIVFVNDGVAFAAGEGTAKITATAGSGTHTDTVTVEVKGFVEARDIVLPYTIWMEAGEQRTVAPVFVPFTLGALELVWTVSDTDLATISHEGVLTAKSAGTVNVTAADPLSGISAAVPAVIGVAAKAVSISLPPKMEIASGWAYNVPIEMFPADANGQPVTWSASNNDIVSVTADGILKPVAAGEAYVVASIGNISDTCYLTILPSKRPVLSLPAEAAVIAGTSKEMFIMNMIADDNTLAQNIRWDFVSSANVTVSQFISIMNMSASNAPGTEIIKVIAIDADNLTDTAELAVTIVPKDSVPPVISLPAINILKGTKSKSVNLLDYVKDDYTEPTFISTDIAGAVPGTTLDEYLNILTISLADDAPLYTSSFTLTAQDDSDNSVSALISINHIETPNTKPVIARIPNQEQSAGEFFAPVPLRQYVRDDYTLPAGIEWQVQGMKQLSARIRSGKLLVTAGDPTWTGSEQLTLTATDEHGASAQRTVWFTQIAEKPQAWPAKPVISFKASTHYTVPGRAVDFYGSVNGSRQLHWQFEGAQPETSNFIQPRAVYAAQGVYDVSLSSSNAYGTTELNAHDFITVIGIEQRQLSVCSGQAATLSVAAEGFIGYEWNTGDKTPSISISPAESAYYSVTITKGLTKVIDSVLVAVTNGLDLGQDTAICEGTALRIGAEGFAQYYWNGSNTAGSSHIDASEAAEYILWSKDASGCLFKDTLVITDVLPAPRPDLGADQLLCGGELADLAAPGFKTYLWSTGATSDAIAVETTGKYSLTVTADNGCSATDTVLVTFKQPAVPSIGVVTVSSSGKNLIAWERLRGLNIESYRVYRQSQTQSDAFDMIAEVPFNALSVVIDEKSDPEKKQDVYGLCTVDSCGIESPMSALHKPIELRYTRNTNGDVLLNWNPYTVAGGDLPFLSYIIYRGEAGSQIAPIDTINAKLTQYTDTDVLARGKMYYRVSILLKNAVVPETLKSDSGPFSQSLSNLAEAVAVSEADRSFAGTFEVSPSPFTAGIDLALSAADLSGARYEIADQSGNIIAEGSLHNGNAQADLSQLPAGTYIAKVVTANGSASKLIVKQ